MEVSASSSSEGQACQRAEISNDIGVTYFAERQLKEAEQWFRRSIEHSRTHGPLPYKNLARTYSDQERYADALEILRMCKELFGQDEDIVVIRSYVHGRLGAYDQAISELEQLATNDTGNPEVYIGLSWLLTDAKHDYKEAVNVLERVKEKFHNTVLLNNLAYAYLMLDNVGAARPLIESLHSKIGSDPVITATWGLLNLKGGNLHEAKSLYQTAARLASQGGKRKLSNRIKQKMHLEFARYLFRHNDEATAAHEVAAGLKVERGECDYASDLIALQRLLLGTRR